MQIAEHIDILLTRPPAEQRPQIRHRVRSGLRRTYRNGLKRVLDVALVVALAPVALPCVGLFALLIRLEDGSPAFYGQSRLGRGGKVFRCWKLRTMVTDADRLLDTHLESDPRARAEWDLYQKLRNDPRITRTGRWLRATSLDELPQLWNVLRGEMSLVGPRPMLPEQRVRYTGSAYYRLRPGLTGPWQVSDRNDCAFERRASWDRCYSSRLSLAFDLLILLRTVYVVMDKKGR